MLVPQAISAVLELLLNQRLQHDHAAKRRMARIANTQLTVVLRELPFALRFSCDGQKLALDTNNEPAADARITLSLSTLRALQQQQHLPALIKSSELELEGDLNLAQQWAKLLAEPDIDWDAVLARYLGEGLAVNVLQLGQFMRQQFTQLQQKARVDSSELIREELRLAPGKLEVAAYCDDVDALREACNKLERRLAQWS